MIQLKKKHGRIEIEIAAYPMGRDLCVLITGGDTPHLGALTAASPETAPETIAFRDHKEFHVTEMAAERLRTAYGGNIAVCCGIHLDNIERQEIADVMTLTENLVGELCVRLRENISA
jgi:hypothetical protein